MQNTGTSYVKQDKNKLQALYMDLIREINEVHSLSMGKAWENSFWEVQGHKQPARKCNL